MIATPRRAHLAFGTFEVDLDAGEIRKSGLRVRLPGQPFRVLAALLSRAGEVVTREELQQEIWGANTNVDFERGIASAVNKIREALGDSAENPRFIETLARRGYRFIAPVTLVEEPNQLLASPAATEPSADLPAPVLLVSPASVDAESWKVPLPTEEQGSHLAVSTLRRRSLGGRSWAWSLVVVGCLCLIMLTAFLTLHFSRLRNAVAPPRVEQVTDGSHIYAGPPNAEAFLEMASDGPRLYVPLLEGGRPQISSLNLDGSQVQSVSIPDVLGSVAVTDISHDGARLLVRSLLSRESDQPLWILPTTGAGALRVGDVLAHDATWMPDGDNRVLFASGNTLSVVQLDTGAVSVVTSLPGRAFWPRWSPDGQRLRFTLLDPVTHATALWQLEAGKHTAHPLDVPVIGVPNACCGSWTRSGDWFVFQESDARSSNLWGMRGETDRDPVQLTNGPVRLMFPLPSLDSKSVYAFGLAQPAGTQVFNRRADHFQPAPVFLADARRISYSRDGIWVAWTDTKGRLWRARSNGSGLLRLTGNDVEVYLARWSPDGQQLLIMAREPGETWQLYTVDASGGALHRLLNDARNLADPDWSADGRRIVFGREAELMGKEAGSHEIQMLDLGTHQLQILRGSGDLFSPRWSPDGQWIAALSQDQSRLLIFGVREGSWRTVYAGGAADPVWASDSKSIYIHAFLKPNSPILRISLEGRVDPIADLTKLDMVSATDYFFSGVTPTGEPLIEPRIGTGNLYSISLPAN